MSLTHNDLTDEQLSTLRHMLGINKPWEKSPKSYRNYAAVEEGDEKFAELSRLGMVEKTHEPDELGTYTRYECTPCGREIAFASHKDIRHGKAKRRYGAFLETREWCPDITFKDFLTQDRFAETRRNC